MGGAIIATYTSNDSIDSFVSFYQSAIPSTGMEIFSTTEAEGATSFLFTADDAGTFGGSVVISPNTNGDDATAIYVSVTSGQ
jgi:hypothetical protein